MRFHAVLYRAGLLLAAAPGSAQTPTVGLFLDDPRAAPGYTLFSPQNSGTSYLIDNSGQLIDSWTGATTPGLMGTLQTDGHLLRTTKSGNAVFTAGGAGGRLQEFDWNGATLWDYSWSSATVLQHHDAIRLPSGNVLFIAWQLRSQSEALAAGRNPALLTAAGLWPDTLIEVQPTGPVSGLIVWEWHVWDHLIQDYSSLKANYGPVASHPELIDLNFSGNSAADWNHINSLDYHAGFDQILVSSHAFKEVWVIDHSTSTAQAAGHSGGLSGKGGDLLYRWGNPQSYRAGTAADRKFYTQHDAQWVPAGFPGAGHITVFNNGQGRPGGNASSADEIAPPVDAAGVYALTPGAAYGPAALFWSYSDPVPTALYSANLGGAQRLTNGDTLITDGTHGTFIEVTAAGETVWKYLNPVDAGGPITQGDAVPSNAGGTTTLVFKARRYPPGYPGLAGPSLSPGFPLEGNPALTYRLLRRALPSAGAPLNLYLPLNPASDLYQTSTATPFTITGDAAAGAPPLIFYAMDNAASLRLARQGNDLLVSFHY
jgi:hypothetical protein